MLLFKKMSSTNRFLLGSILLQQAQFEELSSRHESDTFKYVQTLDHIILSVPSGVLGYLPCLRSVVHVLSYSVLPGTPFP